MIFFCTFTLFYRPYKITDSDRCDEVSVDLFWSFRKRLLLGRAVKKKISIKKHFQPCSERKQGNFFVAVLRHTAVHIRSPSFQKFPPSSPILFSLAHPSFIYSFPSSPLPQSQFQSSTPKISHSNSHIHIKFSAVFFSLSVSQVKLLQKRSC